MGLETWAVFPGDDDEEREFVLEFRDFPTPQTPPFKRTLGPMSEADLRLELGHLGASRPEADAAIADAREAKKRSKLPNP